MGERGVGRGGRLGGPVLQGGAAGLRELVGLFHRVEVIENIIMCGNGWKGRWRNLIKI